MTGEIVPGHEQGPFYYDDALETRGLALLRQADFKAASALYEEMAGEAMAVGDPWGAGQALATSAYSLGCHLQVYEGRLSATEVADIERRRWFLDQRAHLTSGLESPGAMLERDAGPGPVDVHADLASQARALESRAVTADIDDALARSPSLYYALRSVEERLMEDQMTIRGADEEAIRRTNDLVYAQRAFELILRSDPSDFAEPWQRESAISQTIRLLYFGVIGRDPDEREADMAVSLLSGLLQLHDGEYDSVHMENTVTKSYEMLAGMSEAPSAQARALRKAAIAGMIRMADRQVRTGVSAGTTSDLYAMALQAYESLQTQGDHDAGMEARLLIAERPEQDWTSRLLNIARRHPGGDAQELNQSLAYSCELAGVLPPAEQKALYVAMLSKNSDPQEDMFIIDHYFRAGGEVAALSQEMLARVAVGATKTGNEKLASEAAGALTDAGLMRIVARAMEQQAHR